MPQKLNEAESTAAEQAKAMGLEYLGFGGWGNKSDPNRTVVAKTIDGKLVRVGDEEEGEADADLGRISVIDLDDDLLHIDAPEDDPAIVRYKRLLKALIHSGSELVILHARNSEKLAAQYLKSIGITQGPTLLPIGSSTPDKKKEFVQKKIKEGYSEIQYFDRDSHAIAAIDSLKAPYNKLDVRIDTHLIPTLEKIEKDDTTAPPSTDSKGPSGRLRKLYARTRPEGDAEEDSSKGTEADSSPRKSRKS